MTDGAALPGDTTRPDLGSQGTGPARPPTIPDRYRLLELLGRGGMAIVHRAFDRTLGREVALKLLGDEAASEPEGRLRFRREAEAVARLAHPNVVSVFDAGPDYLVMELVPGGPLRRPTPEVLEKVARGVHAAHERGIVHRDLKPSNVLLTAEGEPKVSDFGLAHLGGEHTRLTRSGDVFGTPQYMAPEQVQGRIRDVSPRTDVYALGAMLYEGLTGIPPFRGATTIELFGRIVNEDPIQPRTLDPRISRDMETIALKALEKDPSRRYASALEFAEDLRRCREGEAIAARPPSRWYLLRRRIARRRVLVSAVAAGAAVLGLALAWSLPKLAQARQTERLWRDVSALMAEADLNARFGEVQKARARLDEAIRLCDGSDVPEVDYILGRLHRSRGDDEAALRLLDRALEANPRLGEARLERGLLFAEGYARKLERELWRFSGRLPEENPLAPEECEKAAGLTELRARAEADLSAEFGESAYYRPVDGLYGKAELERLRWNWAAAEKGLRAVLEMDPLHARAWLALAQTAYWRLEFVRAADLASEAIERHKGLAAAYRIRSQALFWRAQSTKSAPELPVWRSRSLADAEEAIRLGDSAYATRGNARWMTGDYGGARADYDRALGLDPRDALTWHQRGLLRVRQNDLVGGLQDYDRALEIAPAYWRAQSNRACARAMAGDAPGAAADARHVLETAPAKAEVRGELEALLRMLGQGR